MHISIWLSRQGVTRTEVIPTESEALTWTIYPKDAGRAMTDEVHDWLEAYVRKEEREAPPIDLSKQTPFTQRVLVFLQTIPFGQTLSYGEIAARLGKPNASRAVGSACGRNPVLLMIPCHRVLAANGKLGGFAAGLDIKRALLTHEGISADSIDAITCPA